MLLISWGIDFLCCSLHKFCKVIMFESLVLRNDVAHHLSKEGNRMVHMLLRENFVVIPSVKIISWKYLFFIWSSWRYCLVKFLLQALGGSFLHESELCFLTVSEVDEKMCIVFLSFILKDVDWKMLSVPFQSNIRFTVLGFIVDAGATSIWLEASSASKMGAWSSGLESGWRIIVMIISVWMHQMHISRVM